MSTGTVNKLKQPTKAAVRKYAIYIKSETYLITKRFEIKSQGVADAVDEAYNAYCYFLKEVGLRADEVFPYVSRVVFLGWEM